MLNLVAILQQSQQIRNVLEGMYSLCRTSWLRIIPVTPFRVHHRLVTSGPNAIPSPWSVVSAGKQQLVVDIPVYSGHGHQSLEDQSRAASVVEIRIEALVERISYLTCNRSCHEYNVK